MREIKERKYMILTLEKLSEEDKLLPIDDLYKKDGIVWKQEGIRNTMWEAAKFKSEIYDKTGVIAKIVPC